MPHHVATYFTTIFHKYLMTITSSIDKYGYRCGNSTIAHRPFGCPRSTSWGCPNTIAENHHGNKAVNRCTQCNPSNSDIATERATSLPMSPVLSSSQVATLRHI
uniref:Uncharacterized protein n=1 Tax=Bactrocera latifrons TaxID=174628 RepID=A0A0K8UYQ4_BACLA